MVTTSYPRAPGDPAGAFVGGFTRWLAGRGHDVQVIAAGPGEATDGDVAIRRVAGQGLFYDEGAPERLERSATARLRAPLFTAALARQVVAHGRAWDAVVSHWLLPSGAAAALLRIPHLAIAHSGDVHLAARAGVADAVVAGILAGGCTRIAFAGEHLRLRMLAAVRRRAAHRALEERSFTCPMGLDVAALASLRQGRVTHDRPVIAFLGRLVPVKGVDVLIDAVARLARPVRLLVGGDGPERTALQARAAAAGVDATFLGEVRGAARDALLQAADVLVLPSVDLPSGRTEGTPTVALEAMAAGVPLVASEVGGVRAVAAGAALLVPPGDAAALAVAIEHALENPDALLAAGRAAAGAHDWSVIGPRLLGSVDVGQATPLNC